MTKPHNIITACFEYMDTQYVRIVHGTPQEWFIVETMEQWIFRGSDESIGDGEAVVVMTVEEVEGGEEEEEDVPGEEGDDALGEDGGILLLF
mmetsp:Transcript_36837/g.77771  ORF Transcript_36837/g.77771 Transcript_36837/m.77771 type:complete len:92 (-) Transcript_36837:352-627(-)